jgi:hypothetical protein
VFHFVSEGHACLRIEAAEPIELAAGTSWSCGVARRMSWGLHRNAPSCPSSGFSLRTTAFFTQADVVTTLAAAALGSRREGLKRPLSARRVVTAIGVRAPSIKQAGCDIA